MKMKAMFALLVAAFALAACGGKGPAETTANNAVKIYQAKGIVRSVDVDGSKITVDHDEIPGFMAAMVMTDDVRDAKQLDGLKEGDKIDLEIERTGSKLVVTKIVKTGSVAVVNGGEIFKANCAECHGGMGEGAPKGISLVEGHALKHSEAEIIARVNEGKVEKDKKMPPFRDKLSPEQIAAVVKYVREEIQKGKSEPDPAGHKH